jgi:hypothetical protein
MFVIFSLEHLGRFFFQIFGTLYLYLVFSAVSYLQQTYTDSTSKTSFFRYYPKKYIKRRNNKQLHFCQKRKNKPEQRYFSLRANKIVFLAAVQSFQNQSRLRCPKIQIQFVHWYFHVGGKLLKAFACIQIPCFSGNIRHFCKHTAANQMLQRVAV